MMKNSAKQTKLYITEKVIFFFGKFILLEFFRFNKIVLDFKSYKIKKQYGLLFIKLDDDEDCDPAT